MHGVEHVKNAITLGPGTYDRKQYIRIQANGHRDLFGPHLVAAARVHSKAVILSFIVLCCCFQCVWSGGEIEILTLVHML